RGKGLENAEETLDLAAGTDKEGVRQENGGLEGVEGSSDSAACGDNEGIRLESGA
ncbi:hypothetical protein AVEN_47219-1, partial [Araneus ventricosus]